MACIMSAAVFTGCGNNHEHRFRWTVLNPATCTEQGLRQGVCGICSYVVDEIIEIDPDNHDYGEWNIYAAAGGCGRQRAKEVFARCKPRSDGRVAFAVRRERLHFRKRDYSRGNSYRRC